MGTLMHAHTADHRGPFYAFFVDDREFRVDEATITDGKIMDLTGIPTEVGLLLILEDGTRESFGVDQVSVIATSRALRSGVCDRELITGKIVV